MVARLISMRIGCLANVLGTVVMDQCTRRIIGFGIQAGVVDGLALCRMFNQAIRGVTTVPRYLSSDHDPLYRFHQWRS
jgi:putative transposase